MKITLEIMGPAKRLIEKNPAVIEVPDGCTVLDLMKSIGYTEIEAKYLVYVRGEERINLREKLAKNDYIKAVLQLGGG